MVNKKGEENQQHTIKTYAVKQAMIKKGNETILTVHALVSSTKIKVIKDANTGINFLLVSVSTWVLTAFFESF